MFRCLMGRECRVRDLRGAVSIAGAGVLWRGVRDAEDSVAVDVVLVILVRLGGVEKHQQGAVVGEGEVGDCAAGEGEARDAVAV